MAQVTEVVVTCDVHEGESEAAGTVMFMVEARSFECELCEDHLVEFREAMEVWSSCPSGWFWAFGPCRREGPWQRQGRVDR